MSRATLVYVLVLAACGAGLWAILRVGSKLKAPPDLAGAWAITHGDGPGAAGGGKAAPDPIGPAMQVEQSGRFVRVSFAGGLVLDLKAVEAPPATVRLAGDSWTVSARLEGDGNTMAVLVRGPTDAAFTARRERRAEGRGGHARKAKAH